MAEKTKTKVKGNKGTGAVISSFVVLMIVLSVLAASVATVIAPPIPPGPASITVAADPASIPADGVATSILTATALKEDSTPVGAGWPITFGITSGSGNAELVGADELGQVYPETDAEGKAYATLLAGATDGDVVIEAYFTGVTPDTTTVHLYIIGTKYNLAISSTDGGNVTVPGEGTTFTYNATEVVNLTAVPDAGWQFVSWTGNNVNTIANVNASETTITMEGDYEITANFERITYTLTMAVSGNGTVVPSVGATCNASDVVLINATPDAGWQFVNWTTGDMAEIANPMLNETTVTMDKNKTVTANFEKIVYGVNLTVTSEERTVALNVTATYTLTVKNTGNANDTFNLTIDNVPASATATLSESVTPELAPDGTYDVSLNVSGAIENEYIVNVTATSQGDISVSDNVTTKTNVVEPTVSIGNAECSVGDPVDVSINITDASNIGAMDINITYNASVLNATSVANGTLIEDLRTQYGGENVTVAYNVSEAGIATINVSFATYPPVINGDGELFVVTFNADAVGNSTLDITVKEVWTADYPPQLVTPITVDGYVNVTGLPKDGDINGDSVLDYKDGPYLVKHELGIPGFGTIYADGDINGDSVLDYKDGPYLVKHELGIPGFETIY